MLCYVNQCSVTLSSAVLHEAVLFYMNARAALSCGASTLTLALYTVLRRHYYAAVSWADYVTGQVELRVRVRVRVRGGGYFLRLHTPFSIAG